ncbi:MAG: DASS family sodium-coupled anion symporter [Candidatus Marinimicrobia bacterium]|nr:DASS family sodium-coupled anion symporter [Candidatus Neomarinimicrobiota bacterium]
MELRYQLLRNLLYWLNRNTGTIAAVIVGVAMYVLPKPDSIDIDAWKTLIIAVITLILIITEPIPLPGIAFVIIILQVYFGIADAETVSNAFMNDAVFFIMGSLMLAVAIIKQGWDVRIALGIVALTGNKTQNIAIGFSIISAVMSSFIGAHTVAAIMLPIGITLIRHMSSEKAETTQLAGILLFSVAYGSLIGSVGSPSGGGRNVIMMIYMKEYGIEPLSYWRWMVYVYPLVFLQIPILGLILKSSFRPEYLKLGKSIRKLKLQVGKSGKVTGNQYFAIFIFILVLLGWVTLSQKHGLGIIALTGVVIYLFTGLVKWQDLNNHVNWGVIILFGAAISLGVQIKNTGAADWLSLQVISVVGESLLQNQGVSDVLNVFLTTIFANILSGTATVAILGPITLNFPGDTLHAGLITAIASSFGYFTAVAAPACVIVYSSGLVRSRDFLRVGWKMGIVSIVVTIIYANIYWPLLK